jgi:hypothetical protein
MNKAMLWALALCAPFAAPVMAGDPEPLDRFEVEELVSNKTAQCRKEKDGSLCVNYFGEEGAFVQVMQSDGERNDGVWFIDDDDRLCILWKGKIRPLCFSVYAQDDDTYNMIRREKHVSTILATEDGNTKGL